MAWTNPGCLQYFRKCAHDHLCQRTRLRCISTFSGTSWSWQHLQPARFCLENWAIHTFTFSSVLTVVLFLCAGVNRSDKAALCLASHSTTLNTVLRCSSIGAFHLFLALSLGECFLRSRGIWLTFTYAVINSTKVWNQYFKAMVRKLAALPYELSSPSTMPPTFS